MNPDPAEPSGAPVRPGDVLAGKYRVDEVLGVGGMGVVVAAHHLQLDERVAIKFLLPEAMKSPETIARFDREARAAVKIKSEHVARVTDVGKLENGAPYMVMEYLSGTDLAGWLAQRGPMAVEQAVELVLQACEAIAEAHVLGIVHRDLKPANIFCIQRRDGGLSIKVLDFGISKVTGVAGSGPGMTRTQSMMGTPLYMSPEQMQSSRDVDPRSDIWSIGVILYELVTGRPPFDGEGIPELVLKIVTSAPPSLRSFRPDAPPGFEMVIERCLTKDKAGRYANVGELAVALGPFGPPGARVSIDRIGGLMQAAGLSMRPSHHSVMPTVNATLQATSAATRAMTAASWGNTAGTANASRAGAWVAVVTAVVLLGGGGVLLATRGRLVTTQATTAGGASAVPSPASAPALPAAPPVPPPDVAATAPDAPSSAAAPPPPVPTPPPSATATAAARPAVAAPSRPSPATPARPAAQAGCDPPFYTDSAGVRRYKPSCL